VLIHEKWLIYGLIVWNPCYKIDELFGYVNLLIIVFLLVKLHAQVVYSRIHVFLCKIGVKWYCCYCFVDDFMTNWCCCCYEMLLLWIHAMGIHNYEDWGEIWFVLESFTKNGWICDFCCNDVLIQVSYVFECLFMSITVWINFGNQFGPWGIKNWDLGQKWGFSRDHNYWPLSQLATESWRRAGGEFWLW